jgi:hypothetical protein
MRSPLRRPWFVAALLVILAGHAAPVHAQPGPERPATRPRQHKIEVPPEVMKLYQDKPVIELVTMGVGSLIWERHGHIALCVRYDDQTQDACYNYGIGDFHHPAGMAWGFFRGTGAFWVGKSSVSDMLAIYQYTDRTIWIQPLPLTRDEKQKVIAKLEHDILEPNKYYAYDHFWDNCTTRVRDIINDATGGKLAAMTETTDGKTYRDLAREGFFGLHMPDPVPDVVPLLITDIAMGRVTDRAPTYYERMFLPQYLREAVTRLWGIPPIAVYERKGPPPESDGPSGRGWLALAIVLFTAPAWITRLIGRGQRFGLALAVVPYVLLGSVLTALAILSPLPYIRWNEAVLVLLPLDLLVLVLPGARRRWYARARLAMLAVLLLLQLVGVLTQPLLVELLWPAIPLAIAALWRDPASQIGRVGAIDELDSGVVVKPARSARKPGPSGR